MNTQQKLIILAAIAGVSAVGLLIILSRKQSENELDNGGGGDVGEEMDFADVTASQTTASASETVVKVAVPQYCVGSIIGKGGTNIRQLKKETGARLDFEKEKDGEEKDENRQRILEIRGEREKVHSAEMRIRKLIAETPVLIKVEVVVPQAACGRIIGRGGQTIREISSVSGAKIMVERHEDHTLNGMRRVYISGNSQQVDYAKGLIDEKVEMEKLNAQKSGFVQPAGRQRSPSPSARPRYPTVRLPSSNDYFEVYVSAFDVPNHFYIQLISPDATKLDTLDEELTSYYGNAELSQNEKPPSRVFVGDMYIAPFQFDEKWYRANVLEINEEEKTAQLFYIDYGDTGKVSFSDLRVPKPEHLELEAQARECMLFGVEPKDGKWTEESINRFEDISHCAMWSRLMARIVGYHETENGRLPCLELIDTEQDEEVNLAETMIKEGYAIRSTQAKASNEQELATIEEEIINEMANNNDMMTQRDRDVTEPTEETQLTKGTAPQGVLEEPNAVVKDEDVVQAEIPNLVQNEGLVQADLPSVIVKDQDLVQAEVPTLAQNTDLVESEAPQESWTVEPVLENHDTKPPMLDEFVNGSAVVFGDAVSEHASASSADYGDGWKRQSAEISSLSSESTEDTVIHVQPASKMEEPAAGDVKEHEVATQEQKVGDMDKLVVDTNLEGKVETSLQIDQEAIDSVERSNDSERVEENKVQGLQGMDHKAEVVLEGAAIDLKADGHVETVISEDIKKIEDQEVSGMNTEIDLVKEQSSEVNLGELREEMVDGAAKVAERGAGHKSVTAEGSNQGVTIEGKDAVAGVSGNCDNEADNLPFDTSFKKSVKEDVARWMESSLESSGQLETISEDGVLEESTETQLRNSSKEFENSYDLQKKPVWKFQQSMELSKENPIILSDDEDDSLSYMSARSELTIASISQDTDADTMSYKSAPDTPTNLREFDFGSNNRDSIIDYDIITTPVGSDDEGLSSDTKQTPKASATPRAPNESPSAVATPVGATPRAGSPSKGVATPMSSQTPRYQISFIDESNGKNRLSNVTSASLENMTSPSSGKLSTSPQRISKLSASTPQFGELEASKSRFGGSGSLFGKETSI